MKKIVCIVLAMAIYANTAFAYGSVQYDDFNEYKSKYRILYGALLVIGGALLTYDGFRTVQVDKSKPSVNMNFASWWYLNTGAAGGARYEINAAGDIANTGNVDLRNVTVWLRYKLVDASAQFDDGYAPSNLGKKITYTSSGGNAANIAIGDSASWICPEVYQSAGNNPPEGQDAGSYTNPNPMYVYNGQYPSSTPTTLAEIVKVEYDFKKKYKDEMNNAYEGVLGLLLVAGGAYLLIDYLVSLNKFEYYMKKNDMNLYVDNTFDEFKFMFSKKI